MASAPAPENHETDRRRREEEAAALALLLHGRTKRYDLPALIRQAKVRPRRFTQIRPTNALKADLAAPYFDITRAWASEVDALIAAYQRGPIAIQTQLGLSTSQVEQIVATAKRRFPAIVQRIEQWHRVQWSSRVRASTGLDVTLLTQPDDVVDDVDATTAWNQALADDVHRQVGHGIATALLAGAAASVPPSEVRARVAEVIAKARKRSAGIGDDQVDKLSRAMDRSRRQAAGVTTFRWRHTPQRHPRDWHKARDGQTFTEETAPEPSDRAGVPPFCKCWEEMVLTTSA